MLLMIYLPTYSSTLIKISISLLLSITLPGALIVPVSLVEVCFGFIAESDDFVSMNFRKKLLNIDASARLDMSNYSGPHLPANFLETHPVQVKLTLNLAHYILQLFNLVLVSCRSQCHFEIVSGKKILVSLSQMPENTSKSVLVESVMQMLQSFSPKGRFMKIGVNHTTGSSIGM